MKTPFRHLSVTWSLTDPALDCAALLKIRLFPNDCRTTSIFIGLNDIEVSVYLIGEQVLHPGEIRYPSGFVF